MYLTIDTPNSLIIPNLQGRHPASQILNRTTFLRLIYPLHRGEAHLAFQILIELPCQPRLLPVVHVGTAL